MCTAAAELEQLRVVPWLRPDLPMIWWIWLIWRVMVSQHNKLVHVRPVQNATSHYIPSEKCRTHSGKWQQNYSTRLKKELLDKPPKGAQFFGTIALMEFVKTRANSSAFHYVASSQRSSPQAISPRLPIRPQCPRFCLAPFQQLPKLFPTVSHPSTMSSRPYRSPRGKVS
jgi:hypothetical protein